MPTWTTHEERALIATYPTQSREKLCALIPRHRWNAIQHRAQTLNVRRQQPARKPVHPLVMTLVSTRRARGLSQEAVARRMNADRSVIARLECGRGLPNLRLLTLWVAALDLELMVVDRPETRAQ